MNASALLHEVQSRGIRLRLVGGRLAAKPASSLTPELRQALGAHKAELLTFLRAEAGGSAAWTRAVTPNSRRPLVPAEVRAKIEAIETEARTLGWPPELLWNSGFWDSPRGLAALLDEKDEIGEVTPDYIEILKVRRDLLRFRRHAT